ncbi:MAG TPA: GDSL-type esterase/lipase family protein [Burkholderiaceae bacterium]|nr:GDSL-type esterase/lipase family protein [Burkholderiaceae bacterium]
MLRTAAALGTAWAVLQGFRLLYAKHHRIYTRAFSHAEDNPARRFLIVGDSTGVGIGSADSRSTVAGRLAAAFPRTVIVNHSYDGARSADIAAQIAESTGRFDLILIFAGGKDAIRLSSYEEVALAADRALDAASARCAHVAVIPPVDVGTAPVWLWPLDALFTRRAELVRRAWQFAMSARTHVHLVDLRLSRSRDPFRVAPRRYYSPDGIHPSADGYALWFAQITRQVPFFAELS